MRVALICARKGSKGVKNKNLLCFDGETLLNKAINLAIANTSIDYCILSTDSEEYLTNVDDHRKLFKIRRPSDLATSSSSKWDVFRHAVLAFEKNFDAKVCEVYDLDVTVPFRTKEHLSKAIELLQSDPSQCVITAYEGERSPFFNIIDNNDGCWSVSKKLDSSVVNRQDAPISLFLSPSVYAFSRNSLFKVEHWSELNINPLLIPRLEGLDIDTEEDLQYLRILEKDL